MHTRTLSYRTYRPRHIIGVVVVALICVYESVTKGWLSFFFVPALIIVLPLLGFGQLGFRAEAYAFSRRLYRAIVTLRIAQVVGVLALYVCGVGFGDTEAVWLFGLVESSVSSPLTVLSGILSVAGGAVFAASSIALLILYFGSLLHKRVQKKLAKGID